MTIMNHYARKITLFLLMGIATVAAMAQEARVLRSGKNLSSNMVNHVMQDRDGLVWISTDNGLNRFDGVRTKIIFCPDDNTSDFRYMLHDSKGRRWACGANHIKLYDNASETLVPIEAFEENGTPITFSASKIKELSDGSIIVCTPGHGLFRLSQKNGKYIFVQDRKVFKQYFISNILEDKYGNCWICSEQGISRWDGKRLMTVAGSNTERAKYYSDILEDANGTIWCSSDADGVVRINKATMTMEYVEELRGTSVHCLLRGDNKYHILAGTNGKGVWSIDIYSLKGTQVISNDNTKAGGGLNVHSLMGDRDGNLWIGCYQKGVLIEHKRGTRFGYIGGQSRQQNWIGSSCVNSLSGIGNSLWVASDNDGLYKITDKTPVHYAPGATMPKTVMCILPDGKGNAWMGTWLQGLWYLNGSTGKATPVDLHINDNYSVFSLLMDKYGKLWIGSLGSGLYNLDVNTGEVKKMPQLPRGKDYNEKQNLLPNGWINKLCMGPGDIMYIGTCDGLAAINVRTGNYLDGLHGINRIMGGTSIVTLCYTPDGRLWAGSNSGLTMINAKTLQTMQFKKEQGIIGNNVQSIVNDGKGTLWISTNLGIVSMSLANNKTVYYSSEQDMQGTEFSKNSVYSSPDGTIYYGGTEGVCYFNPETLKKNITKPNVIITGLYVNGKEATAISESGGEKIMSTDIMHAKEIELSYSDNDFTLEFSTLNYLTVSGATFEYRVDGDRWTALPAGTNRVTFTSLAYGSHEIEYRVKVSEQYSDVKKITINIRAPWYATWWAMICYALLFVGIILFIRQVIQQRHQVAIDKLKYKQQEEIVEQKTQFFMNISHEIRTPMTLIVSPLQRLIKSDPDPQRQATYKTINRNAQRILLLVNQMLDVRKIDKGQMELRYREIDIVEYLDSMVDGFHELCNSKHITLDFQNDSRKDALNVWIDPMNFDKIIINLLSNAFKYTPENGNIKVILKAEATTYSITVEDDGIGLVESEIKHIFKRFFQQHHIANSFVQGSGIGLHLTHSLVEMHHGTIVAENNGEGRKGCHFTVTMPLGRDHIKDSEIETSSQDALQVITPEDNTKPNARIMMDAVAPEESTTGEHEHKTRKRLLLVEDDHEIARYLISELSAEFHVTHCSNGDEGLKAVLKKTPDIIVSDVMMPVMDGITMLKQIRHNTTVNNIPVILLTAKSREQDNIEGLHHGADAYITKPFNIEILRSTALNLVQRHNQLKNIFSGKQTPEIENKVKVMSPDEKLLQRIMKVINANLTNPELGNDLITREVGISRVHLYRKLKELTNLSLRDFIKNIRLTEAARLLSEQKHSISEVAQRTGFDNVSYFTVVFKQKYGVPPSAYTKSLAATKEDEAAEASEKNAES